MRAELLLCLLTAGNAGASCYRPFDAGDRTLYEACVPPFDISYPGISRAYEASRARGARLQIDSIPCRTVPAVTAGENNPQQNSSGRDFSSGTATGQDRPFYGYGRDIQIGPRGGHYYINEKGRKVYVDQ
jgi:hypothetical protein